MDNLIKLKLLIEVKELIECEQKYDFVSAINSAARVMVIPNNEIWDLEDEFIGLMDKEKRGLTIKARRLLILHEQIDKLKKIIRDN